MVASLIDYVPCRHEGAGPVSASRRHAVSAQDVPDIPKKLVITCSRYLSGTAGKAV
jgi:hypothetical protein